MLGRTYEPTEAETRIYQRWESAGLFAPRAAGDAPPYCIMLPPPNVTGSLHMGHALDHTIQDALIRFHRMRGALTLWQPGTDHAGIATQMVVERELARSGSNVGRRELGRAAFVERIWAWREQSGGTIVRQMRRLGQSADWSRERFTMDAGLSAAVVRVFVQLHREGLIYKDKRLVNWDPKLQTAISDLEVVPTEVDGHLWYLRYPLDGQPDRWITVATTRPETMLGDTAVAVHPDDARYADLVGRRVVLPLAGRVIPIIADPHSDPAKGSGAVKITPAHDFNDFEVGRRHGLATIAVIDAEGRIAGEVPGAYRGLDRFEARRRIVADLDSTGALEKVERHRHVVPHGDRSGVPVEPYLTEQWYCDAATLAKPAIEAVETGRTRFVPEQWSNTYFAWMRNIQPWCISRQLWWGHQIPAWYGPDGQLFVAETEADAAAMARGRYGRDEPLRRDEDVLDTWFSSALWPFSTLGWPERTPELARFYPGSVLVTGFDIIFFWVARMMMMGLHLMGEVPFREVYIHGLVRDEGGQKMSKTKGNVIDPLELADAYGADALRLALLASTAQGRDIKFGPSRVEGYRNFVTKLWNAARFLELNGAALDPGFDPSACRIPTNRWIIGATARAARATTAALQGYRLNDATLGLYHFVRDTFCDWWVELSKPLLAGGDPAAAAETRAAGAWVLGQTLHLLHPIAPFVTEELWDKLLGAPGGPLIVAPWPELDEGLVDPQAEQDIGWLVATISAIRSARSELNVPPAAQLELLVQGASAQTAERLQRHDEALRRLARLARVALHDAEPPAGSLQVVIEESTMALPVAGVIDLAQERQRLRKELDRVAADTAKLAAKLDNPSFIERAPAEVVAEQRERCGELQATGARLAQALARIS